MPSAEIRFGTDGWRAIVGEDFNDKNLTSVARATAQSFLELAAASDNLLNRRVYVGYDTRSEAKQFAALVAEIMAASGLEIVLSDRYIPTPALCWTVSRDERAIGGVQLTASHNPAAWLGLKVRMSDGGASPAEFTDEIERFLTCESSAQLSCAESSERESFSYGATNLITVKDVLTPYLDGLCQFVDSCAIEGAQLKVVVDPLYGAARGYLADIFERLGVEVLRLHDSCDPSFGGLHPEPILPWTAEAATLVKEVGAQAGFVTDGDADRLGAIDEEGNFIPPHMIIALIAQHLVENRKCSGRIIKTLSTSVLVDRIGRELGVDVSTTAIGFKWIYDEMLAGDVLIGGEESGGIGIPSHMFERDGLLMSLLLAEMMAVTDMSLKALVDQLEMRVGKLYYQRRDVRIDPLHMERFRASLPTLRPAHIASTVVEEYVHIDGTKFLLANDEWLLLRASGTEPLVRIYAEATTAKRLEELLTAGNNLVQETA